jgi:hypothetical protein
MGLNDKDRFRASRVETACMADTGYCPPHGGLENQDIINNPPSTWRSIAHDAIQPQPVRVIVKSVPLVSSEAIKIGRMRAAACAIRMRPS